MKMKKKDNRIVKIRAKLKKDFGLSNSYYFTKYKDIKKYFKFFNKLPFTSVFIYVSS